MMCISLKSVILFFPGLSYVWKNADKGHNYVLLL